MKRKHRSDPTRRKRGAQPDNQNAYKHGFYSELFRQRERKMLEQMQPADLSAEIELIRVTSARFLESLAASRDHADFESNLTALRAVNISAQSIAMLLRVQALSGTLKRDMADALKTLEDVAGRPSGPPAHIGHTSPERAEYKLDNSEDPPEYPDDPSPDAWGLVPAR